MALLNESQLDTIANAVTEVEKQTDAELVTVLARRADHYYYIPTLWAAVIALLIPFPLHYVPLWLQGQDLLVIQWIVFIVLAIVLRFEPIMMRLVPRHVRYWRATNLARRAFLENNLHYTKDDVGMLIFVSEAEHYVEIIADRGISQHVSNDQWQNIIDRFTQRVKARQIEQGFIECINACGELLKQHVPATSDKNELPNRLVLL